MLAYLNKFQWKHERMPTDRITMDERKRYAGLVKVHCIYSV